MTDICYSLDEELYKFDTIQDAVDSAYGDKMVEVSGTIHIWEGRAVRPSASSFCSFLIDGMQERAYDEHGEYAEDWLDSVKEEYKEELEIEVETVIDDWAKRNKCQPHFYSICDAKLLTVRVDSEDSYTVITNGND